MIRGIWSGPAVVAATLTAVTIAPSAVQAASIAPSAVQAATIATTATARSTPAVTTAAVRSSAPAASKATAGHFAKVAIKAKAGAIAPSGTALISGKLPKHRSRPKAYVLSHNSSFGSGDRALSSVSKKAAKGTFRTWISLADDTPKGHYRLLGCRNATPSAAACFAIGKLQVVAAPTPVVANPSLETSRAVSHVFTGTSSSATATAADGTTYTLTVPPSDLMFTAALTPVSSLSPATAVGSLVDGVMITPVGEAPPGSTLVIKPGTKPDATAKIVGFGGIDPSGGAVPLPIVLGKTAKIPVVNFGGYGIAESTAHQGSAARACPAAATGSRPAAAGARPIMSCSSAANRTKQLSDALAPEIGVARQAELSGSETPNNVTQDLNDAPEVGLEAIDEEAGRVFNQPPSEEGAAELDVLTTLAIGDARDIELLDHPDEKVGKLLNEMMKYRLEYLKRACQPGGGSLPAAALLADAYQAFGAYIQYLRLDEDGQAATALTVRGQCLLRVKIQLDVTDASHVDNRTFNVKAAVTADDIMITGRKDATVFGGVALRADDKDLSYDSASVKVDPPSSEVEEATITDKSGLVHINNVGYSATTRVRCDKNRKFVFDYSVLLWLYPQNMWQDTQTIQISVEGTVIGTQTASVEAAAWSEGLKANRLTNPFKVKLEKKTVEKHSGTCSAGGCKSYSYDATFDPQGQDG